ncbi:AIR synthase-related protein [Flavonifractor plautii]|nr:AIR synthase-related protein [Flavonifractor plautii]
MLTKPLGTGILTTAAKAELLSGAEYRAMTDLMAALNRDAARAAVPLRPSACTDVTGFGLIGHARDGGGAGCTIELWPGRVPIVPQALELARTASSRRGPTAIWSLPGRRWRRRGPSPGGAGLPLRPPDLRRPAPGHYGGAGAELLRRLADAG